MNPDNEQQFSEDPNLWESFKKGDEKAFSLIFRKHYSFLYNYGQKLTKDPAITKDILQDLFITIWKNRQNLGNTSSIKFYLLKSLRRKIARVIKNDDKHSEYTISDDYEFEIEFSTENLIIIEQSLKDRKEYLLQMLNLLSKRQKEAVYLKFYQGLSYEEIGKIMNLNNQSIRNYIHQAIVILRNKVHIPSTLISILLPLFS